jgi:UDP-N-acetylmuramate--alanine ligase
MTRSVDDIGEGLAPARAGRAIRAGELVHVVGVGGAGASAAAILAQAAGAVVTACDSGGPSPYSPAVEAAGIPISWVHDPDHVRTDPAPDRLAVTKALTAVAPDHPELAAARAARIVVEPWQQLVADAATGRALIGVAGTHGKSTSAGWLVHLLAGAGRDPTAFVGAVLPAEITGGIPGTARVGAGREFVVEADEYAGNFDSYRPHVAVVTNVEWDHPDVFADESAAVDMFEAWLRADAGAVARPTLVINAGNPGAAALRARLADWPGEVREFEVVDGAPATPGPDSAASDGTSATTAPAPTRLLATIQELSPAGTTVELRGDGLAAPMTVRLPTAGRHNVANAAAVTSVALALNVPPSDIVRGLETFPGVGRRLERLGEARRVVVYDDYGHHPTAIRETLAAVRQREPGRPIWAVYEPLTYHRTAAMLDEFAEVLATAHGAVIADVWAGRDSDTSVTSATALARAVRKQRRDIPAEAPGNVEETADWLAAHVRPNDAVLVMGGGHSYRIGRLLLEALTR